MIDIYEELRIILLRKGLSVRKLARLMEALGYKMPKESGLSNKFKNKSVRFEEVQIILDYLGYELVIKEK